MAPPGGTDGRMSGVPWAVLTGTGVSAATTVLNCLDSCDWLRASVRLVPNSW